MKKTKFKFHWTDLKHLGIIGVVGIFWKPELKLFFLFYLISFLEVFRKAESEPLPKGKTLNRYYVTLILSQFNVLMYPLILKQAFGQIIILLRNIKGFPDPDTYINKAEYILPFQGSWKAVNGGSTRENSHSWDIFTQRYAYDFVITDSDNLSYTKEGLTLTDYYCYEKEVLSPAEGVVIAVSNKIKDYKGVGDYSIDWKTTDFRGNFVIIQHHPKEYSFIAHLKLDSIKVKEGDKVKQGEIIGLCGNSGHSTEPHIHFHLQDSKNLWIATGLPIRFRNFAVKSATNELLQKQNDFVEKGDTVSNF